MRIISIMHHKGGVGKTTSAMNISAGLALKELKVVVIDLDAQANLTQSFGLETDYDKNILTAFQGETPLPILNISENLFVVPSCLDFSIIESQIMGKMAREKILTELLEPLKNQFDYCILDCPPSLSLVTINALVASDELLIPMTADKLAYNGLKSIFTTVTDVKKHYNNSLLIKGIFFTKFNKQTVLSKTIKEKVIEEFGSIVLKTEIRTNITLAESQSKGEDIFSYDPTSNGAEDYGNLINEIIK